MPYTIKCPDCGEEIEAPPDQPCEHCGSGVC